MELECPNCGNIMLNEEEVCRYCGTPNSHFTGGKKRPHTLSKGDDLRIYDAPNPPAQEKKGSFNLAVFIVLLILFWPAAIIYIAVTGNK